MKRANKHQYFLPPSTLRKIWNFFRGIESPSLWLTTIPVRDDKTVPTLTGAIPRDSRWDGG